MKQTLRPEHGLSMGGAHGRPMAGLLEVLPLFELLPLLAVSRKSGDLTVKNGVSTGKIFLRGGAIYFATVNRSRTVSPQKSIYRMLTWLTGTFELDPSCQLVGVEEIHESTDALLVEGRRQLDELRKLQQQLPSLDSPLGVPTPLAGKLVELNRSELEAFQLVLDHGQLQMVLDDFPGTVLDAAHAVISLMKQDFVVVP